MERPRILISGSAEGCENYMEAVAWAGGAPSGGYCPAVDLSYDGLLLCGGEDVDPVHFGEVNTASEGIDPARDAAELALARAYLAAGRPVFGICRGHQLLNVVLGGTLIQDMGPEKNLFHRRTPDFRGDKVHPVRCEPNSLMFQLYGSVAAVNSSHHQAVGQLGEGLRVTAWSESGVAEALEHARLPLISVQFHPERMCCAKRRPDTVDGGLLFQRFIALCSEHRRD